MISTLQAKGFKAVPYLETSLLMASHPKGLKFSRSKPNVIVGPNGAGKSALLSALALQTLSFFTGESSFDDNFVIGGDSDTYWGKVGASWSREYEYLPGLTCTTDNAPALYYRPGHIPGNECTITHAMMTGYFNEARAHADLVKAKSSGQQSQALLQKLQTALAGDPASVKFRHVNWRAGKAPKVLDNRHHCDFEYRAEVLKKRYPLDSPDAMPVLLLDEPEQSLDAKAEVLLWKQIEAVDNAQVQVIVATHSLYPLMHPKSFNLIEAVPGYVEQVQALI